MWEDRCTHTSRAPRSSGVAGKVTAAEDGSSALKFANRLKSKPNAVAPSRRPVQTDTPSTRDARYERLCMRRNCVHGNSGKYASYDTQHPSAFGVGDSPSKQAANTRARNAPWAWVAASLLMSS